MENYPTKSDGVSTEPAAEYNNLASELKTVVTSLGITLNAGLINQLAEAIATYSLMGQYYTDGGTADTYILSAAPVTRIDPTAYYAGMKISFIAANANTGASTVNVAGLGAKTIVLEDGSTALSGGEITATTFTNLIYDGTNFRMFESIKDIPNFVTGSYTGSGGTETISGLSFRPELVEIFLVTTNISVWVHDDDDPNSNFHGDAGAAGANYNITITSDGFQATGATVITNTNKFFWKAIKP